MKEHNCCVSYRINEHDEIISVNDAWCRYAGDHGYSDISPEKVLNKPVYNFITDSTTSKLYQYLFKRVREGSTARYRFYCESNSHRRLMEMTVKPFGDRGEVELNVRMLSKQAILRGFNNGDNSPTDKFLLACGWCSRINIEGFWWQVEEALGKLEVFEFSQLPQLTHGICKDCYDFMLKDAASANGAIASNQASTILAA